ncbi:histidine phosphatase family protein [bacterium]|nr:MAG: histidine phosphatase family protein [bacterium]
MKETRIYIVRHGRTAWNDIGQAQGHTDIHLDDIGQAQARALAARFHGHSLDAVFSSDLARAFETAAPVAEATGTSHEATPMLRERGFGEWEGMAYAEVNSRLAPTAKAQWYEMRPPGGESYGDVWDRVDPFVQKLWQMEGDIMVVSHGGTSAILLAHLLKGTVDTSRAFRFSNTGVTVLEKRPEGLFRLLKYDDTSHLP